jgi:hypothetical protein
VKPDVPRTRNLVALDGAISLIAILLIVQMWLLTSSLEAYLAGHTEVAVPAAGLCALLFAACAGLYRSIVSIDRLADRGVNDSADLPRR